MYSNYKKNIIKIFSSSGIAQLVTLIAIVIAARHFSPAEFAEYGFYVSTLTILSTFSTLRLEIAVLKYSGEEEYSNLFFLAMMILTTFTLLVLLSLNLIEYFVGLNLIKYTVTGLFFYSLQQYLLNMFSSKEEYGLIGKLRVVNSVIFLLLIAIINDDSLGLSLIDAHIISFLITSLICLKYTNIKLSTFSTRKIKELYIENDNYWKFDTLSGFLNTLSRQSPNIILPFAVGKDISGYYFFCQRLVVPPVNLIANSVGNVFRKAAINEYNKSDRFDKLFKYTFKFLLKISVVVIMLSMFISEDVFVYIFGEDWSEGYRYLHLIIILNLFKLIVSPLTFSFYVVDKIRENLIGQFMFMLLMVLPLILVPMITENEYYTITIHVLCGLLAYIGYGLYSYLLSKGEICVEKNL